jgi:valyl-tRNA synthetase
MSAEDQEEDFQRSFLTVRADYFGPASDWEKQLTRWERSHPDWPISRQ